MVSTEEMLNDIIKNNIEFNEVLDANQKGYEVRYLETNYPEQYSSFPGFKILDNDDLFTKVRVFLRTDPLVKTRIKEKPRDIDRTHYLQISYKNGMGGIVVNTTLLKKNQLEQIIKKVENV